MPVSDMNNIGPIMNEVWRLKPTSILDLGIGVGTYGMLCRTLLDIAQERLEPARWQTNIVGIEGHVAYRNPAHEYFYNDVYYHDFTTREYKGYDLVLMIDSLEHITKSVGHKLLDDLVAHNKRVLVSCPTGQNYVEQGAVFGNEFERHRAHWTPDDFEIRGGKILHHGVCVVASIGGTAGKENPWLTSGT